MMVRDTDDPNIPDWPDSDASFQIKYGEQLKKWGEAQGLPEQVAKYLWRAHWSIPAPGQLFEFYHRLRKLPDGDPRRVDLAEIQQALQQQDILPRWIPKFLAVSFHPMGRIDIRRAYAVGTLTVEEMTAAFSQLGYDDPVVDQMVRFTRQQVRVSLLNAREVKQYQAGAKNYDDAYSTMLDRGVQDDDAQWTLNRAQDDMRSAGRAVCVRGVRRRYLTGEIDQPEAVQMLATLGLDDGQIDIFVSAWVCDLTTRGPVAQSSTLCQWLDSGLITGEEMLRRLVRIGWDVDDATMHVAVCERRIGVRMEREERRRRREEAARLAIEERERDRQAQDLTRRATALQAAAAAKIRRRELRDASMQRAAKILSVKLKIPASSTGILVRDAVQNVKATHGRTIDEAIRAAVLAAEACKGEGCEEYLSIVEQYAIAEIAAEEVTGGNGEQVSEIGQR
jgi:hypothetical protein